MSRRSHGWKGTERPSHDLTAALAALPSTSASASASPAVTGATAFDSMPKTKDVDANANAVAKVKGKGKEHEDDDETIMAILAHGMLHLLLLALLAPSHSSFSFVS